MNLPSTGLAARLPHTPAFVRLLTWLALVSIFSSALPASHAEPSQSLEEPALATLSRPPDRIALAGGALRADAAQSVQCIPIMPPMRVYLPLMRASLSSTPVNHPPVTTNCVVTLSEDTSGSIDLSTVAADADGDPLAFTIQTGPARGTASINQRMLTYTPAAHYAGSDLVTYHVSDGRGGTAQGTIRMTVTPINDPPAVSLIAAPISGTAPLSPTFTVSATDPDNDPLTYTWSFGDGATAGNQALIAHQYGRVGTYTATVVVSDGQLSASASQTITIHRRTDGLPDDPATISPLLDPSVATDLFNATEFLYTGDRPIQTGVTSGTIETRRVSVLRGKVLKRDGAPLPGVAITILDHPEYGQTLSRADGMFDMAVNGGGVITLVYTRTGYLPAQRQVDTPWTDYAEAPDVVLIQQDPAVTTVDLTSNIPMQVVRSSLVSDADGVRQQVLLFPQGTQAFMTLPSGITQTLTVLNVRSTEYTVGTSGPETMPAALPPNSAYTYAAEFSVDEATAAGALDIEFSKPIISYLENFLEFPVGTSVPMGYYDKRQAVWVASDSGKVIKVLSKTGGKADLDIDGSGTPASAEALAALQLTEAEREELARLYQPGQSLWRILVPHFSTWDANQGTSCEEPCERPKETINPDNGLDDPCIATGSVIGCETQTLGETIDVIGTPFSLHYGSDRVPGYRYESKLSIPVSERTPISPSLRTIYLEIKIAGRTYKREFPPEPNLRTTFIWDGLDAYGRALSGYQPVTVKLGYAYRLVYKPTERFGYNGNGSPITTGRNLFILWQQWNGGLLAVPPRTTDLAGWNVDIHHIYDPTGQVLYRGDGGRRSASALNFNVIKTVAGTGGVCNFPWCPEGLPATSSPVTHPFAVTVAPDGTLYIVQNQSYVRRVSPDGILTTIAGQGTTDGDGVPATSARLFNLFRVVAGSDGSLYLLQASPAIVRRITPDGIITTIAGTRTGGSTDDNIPAVNAQLNLPTDIALGPNGSLYILEHPRVRRVGLDGIITTVAGTRFWCGGSFTDACGDNISATAAKLGQGYALAADQAGNIYFGDEYGQIRRVGPDGIITTIAGVAGQLCRLATDPCGDGELATQAKLTNPQGLAVGPDGTLYTSEYVNHRIRRISPDGFITTIAGSGESCGGRTDSCGDEAPATRANFYNQRGIAVGPDGSVYVADYGTHRVRRIFSPFPRGEDNVIASEDGSELYFFTRSGRHVRTLNAVTGALRYKFDYDKVGHLIGVMDGDGNRTTIEWDDNGHPTAIVGPYGHRTTLTVDINGYLGRVTNPAGESFQLDSTPSGLLTRFTNPRGLATAFQYNDLGRLRREDNAGGGSQTLLRTDPPPPIADTEPSQSYTVSRQTGAGRTTLYVVKEALTGLSRTTTRPDGTQTSSTKHPNGTSTSSAADGTAMDSVLGPDPRWGMFAPVENGTVTTPAGLSATAITTRTAILTDTSNPLTLRELTERINVNGQIFSTSYDGIARSTTVRSPEGRTAITTIDARGRPVLTQPAGLLPTSFEYDNRGRLKSATQGSGPDARTVTFTYNSKGELETIVDPLNRIARFEYDLAGRVVKQTLPDSRVIGYAYDANGNLTSITPPGRPAHSFSYTPVDLTASYSPPAVAGAGGTAYSYNLDRQLTQVSRPDGQTIDLGYDTGGRPSTVMTARGVYSYSYQPTTGNLATIGAPGGIGLAYSYDGALLKSETWSGAIAGSSIYTYDNDFRIASSSVNGGNTISFQYDKDSLLKAAGALALSRDPQNGLLTGSALGNISDSWGYNGFAEPTSYSAAYNGGSLYNVTFTRDKLGRIVGKAETIAGTTTTYAYTYDLAGRLTEVKQNGATIATYTYDSNGNRLTGPGVASATYDAQDRLLQYGSTTYGYTPNGELASKTAGGQVTTYQYDALGNLTAVTLPNGTQITYLADGRNRRIGKQINGAPVQGWLYEGQLRPVAELDGAGNIVSRFVYATRINVPDYMIKAGATYRIITDHLGSPRLVVNIADGTVVQRMDFDAWGNVTLDTNPGFQPFGFAGGLYDRDTKLVRFGARDYDAETGRWTAKDPIEFTGGGNFYIYANNNPLMLIDPEGTDPEGSDWAIAIGGQVGAGLVGGGEFGVGYLIEPSQLRISTYNTGGTGVYAGSNLGASVNISYVHKSANFWGSGTESGLDYGICGGTINSSTSSYDCPRCGKKHGEWFGTFNGFSFSVGPSVGLGGAHYYHTVTEKTGSFDLPAYFQGLTEAIISAYGFSW